LVLGKLSRSGIPSTLTPRSDTYSQEYILAKLCTFFSWKSYVDYFAACFWRALNWILSCIDAVLLVKLLMFVSCMLRLFNAYHLVDDVVIFTLIIQIRTIMVDNIEKVLERGDRIELLVDKTATMQDSSFHFRKQSKRLRRALWMKNFKLLWVKVITLI
jgi:hypothetical protein